MGKYVDITGMAFGQLVALGFSYKRAGHQYWLFRCSCGAEIIADKGNVKSGHTSRCKNCALKARSITNTTHGMTGGPTWRSWQSAKLRCFNPANAAYSDYGGRGITMCEEWANSFEAFLSYMGPRPEDCSLDRIDVNGNYEPGNVRWATDAEQCQNTRRTKLTPENVVEIRQSTESNRALARKFNAEKTTIAHARKRKTWKNIA